MIQQLEGIRTKIAHRDSNIAFPLAPSICRLYCCCCCCCHSIEIVRADFIGAGDITMFVADIGELVFHYTERRPMSVDEVEV